MAHQRNIRNDSGTQVTAESVDTEQLADGAVTADKLAANTVIPPSVVDAKGDLLVGTADNTVDNLARRCFYSLF